jgi:hypothetical protein
VYAAREKEFERAAGPSTLLQILFDWSNYDFTE